MLFCKTTITTIAAIAILPFISAWGMNAAPAVHPPLTNDDKTSSNTARFLSSNSISLDKTSYAQGEDIVVSYTSINNNVENALVIYPRGDSSNMEQGSYLVSGCTSTCQEVPATPSTSGSVTFTTTSSTLVNTPFADLAGAYDIYLVEQPSIPGFLAGPIQFDVYVPSYLTSSSQSIIDAVIEVSFNNDDSVADATTTDWIGIYPAGSDPVNTPALLWMYLDGSQIAPARGTTPISNGVLTFSLTSTSDGSTSFPLPTASYDLIYFSADSYNVIIAGPSLHDVVDAPSAAPR